MVLVMGAGLLASIGEKLIQALPWAHLWSSNLILSSLDEASRGGGGTNTLGKKPDEWLMGLDWLFRQILCIGAYLRLPGCGCGWCWYAVAFCCLQRRRRPSCTLSLLWRQSAGRLLSGLLTFFNAIICHILMAERPLGSLCTLQNCTPDRS